LDTKQLQCEVDAWLRMLIFLKEENVYLKTRLADIAQVRFDKNFLDEAEKFQASFINNDTIIALLKNDILTHSRLSARYTDLNNTYNIPANQKELREDMEKLEKEFRRLTVEFNNYADKISSSYRTA
jgi:hypothetical protein